MTVRRFKGLSDLSLARFSPFSLLPANSCRPYGIFKPLKTSIQVFIYIFISSCHVH